MTAQQFLTSRLEASGLSAADATMLGIKAMENPPNALSKAGPGFVIPYFDKAKRKLQTFRYRRDLDRLTGFDKLKDAPKYLQPEGTAPEIYLPPFKGTNWNKLLGDVKIPLLITEGELKAAAAVKSDFTCIGLGGVWSWRSKRNNQSLLPALREIAWEGRNVYIIYDSDAISNPQVALAEQALCQALSELSAVPHIVRLPTLDGQMKTGLDDFLLAKSADELDELIGQCSADELTAAIDRMNSRVSFIKNMHEIYEHSTGRFIPLNKFTGLSFANEYVEQVVNGKMAQIPIAIKWVKSRRRAEVDDLMFKPAAPELMHETVRVGRSIKNITALNTWKGWGCDSKKGDVSLFSELLDYFCQNEQPEARRWLEQWLAFPVQYPGTKLYSAVVVWSTATGTGKSFLGDIVGGIYGTAYTSVTHSMLEKNFNGWAENKQFIMGSEITGNDSRRFADQLKDMITRSKMHVERKYVESYEINDCANYYFTSNHPDAFFLDDQDRRFFVIDASFAPLPSAFYKKLDTYYKHGDGLAALRHHFEHLDMTGFSPVERALQTSAKTSMTEHGRSNLSAWLADFRSNRDKALTRTVKGLEHLGNAKLFTAREIFRAYQVENDEDRRSTVVTISKNMASIGLQKVANRNQIVTSSGREYVWADPAAHPELFNMPGAKVAQAFDQERGKKTPKERKF